MAEPFPAFTPVSLLTGFLGSGKTTLLNRILANPAFADTAVIVNEFGEIGLDQDLLSVATDDVILLPSGCICCAMRGDLVAALKDLHSRRSRGLIPVFRRVIVESTGLADPYPVISSLKADAVLRHHFRVGTIVTTIDAINGPTTLERYREAVKQVAVADTLVVTKTDITTGTMTELISRLGALNPLAKIVEAVDQSFNLATVLPDVSQAKDWFKATAEPDGREREEDLPHTAGDRIRSVSLIFTEPLDWTAFGIWLTMLVNRHGANILRVKGILSLQGEPNPIAIHGVQHLVYPPHHLTGWPGADRRSRLVFIVDGIEPDMIRRSFAAFMSLSAITVG